MRKLILLSTTLFIFIFSIHAQDCSVGNEEYANQNWNTEDLFLYEIEVTEFSTVTDLAFNSNDTGNEAVLVLYEIGLDGNKDLLAISEIGICDGNAVILDIPDTQISPGTYYVGISTDDDVFNIKGNFDTLVSRYWIVHEWGDPIPESAFFQESTDQTIWSLWAVMDCGWTDCAQGTKDPIYSDEFGIISDAIYAFPHTFEIDGYLTDFGFSTTGSGAPVTMALYENNGSDQPGNLIVQSSLETSILGINLLPAPSLFVPAGDYYIGIMSSSVVSLTKNDEPGIAIEIAAANVSDGYNSGDTYSWNTLIFSLNANLWVEMSCEIPGCTDFIACNYNSAAEVEDGSCEYGPDNDWCGGVFQLLEGTSLISNEGACYIGDETVPNTGCNVTDGWCNSGLEHTVYYFFDVPNYPASITFETKHDGTNTWTDTQMAILFDDCGGPIVGANDDGGTDQFMSYLHFECGELDQGTSYFILLDGWNGDQGSALMTITVDPLACDCQGDANGDGLVNIVDALAVSSFFGCVGSSCEGDANHDGVVNIVDLLTISANWGFICP